jgi:hypothetical protein
MISDAIDRHEVHASKYSMQSSMGGMSRLCRVKSELIVLI